MIYRLDKDPAVEISLGNAPCFITFEGPAIEIRFAGESVYHTISTSPISIQFTKEVFARLPRQLSGRSSRAIVSRI